MIDLARIRRFFLTLPFVFAAGCRSYDIVQANIFSDDDGNLVRVEYGRSEKHHVNTFVSPVTGEEMEFKSKLVVEVRMPDGESFRAWQCMNFLSSGTMYKTDDGEWMFLAGGFTCTVYARTEEDETRYLEVYRGVLCESPHVDAPKNDKWKTLPRTQGRRWK